MEETLKQNEPEVKALEKLLSDINSIKEKSMLLYNVKNNEITLEILAELAAIMPKDSWITNLHYKGIDRNDKKKTASELIVNGYAASSSTLIPLLEDSPFFEKVEFVGPIKKTKDKEQFKLSARIVRPANQESETK
jgi:Tfp pilus assembly protein PilN